MTAIVRVWDAPTRLFHWMLVLCFIGLLVSAQWGGGAMVWHFRLGYCMLTLLLFRLVWGFQGGHWSRFATFYYRPIQVLQYLQGRAQPEQQVGHNPLGALSVFAMLSFLFFQVLSGLMSDDEIASAGPLTRLLPSEWVSIATYYHKEIGRLVLLVLAVTHLCAIAYYRIRSHDNLVRPMVTGDKTLSFPAQNASDTGSDRLRAGAIFLVCGVLVASAVSLLS